ncbi:LOW QUALITY PROTEIN: transcription initiation factor TFIID subunit 12 [Galendromus occidentalis]|uniref:Transcription initiation factor TFIID subunit 12 n=1 Tax=Galendromus occidentalis TaxID=34638 RepID=A0AAJ6QT23_9ACAR|nr:LOW QUALITY PROTEIN: transcription initiation factor TFIID subunit 12 [Galendromus occidentalis]
MSLPPSHIVVSSSPTIFSQVQTFPQATIVQSNQTMVQVPVSGLGPSGLVTTIVRPIQSVITPSASNMITSTAQAVTAMPQVAAKVNNTQVVSVPATQVQTPSRPILATASNSASATATTVAASNKMDESKKKTQIRSKASSQRLRSPSEQTKTLSVSKLEDLVKEVDTMQQIDDEVENVLFSLADDFIDNVVNASCLVSKNRKSSILDTKDVAIVLERQHGLYIPGFGGEDLHTYKKTTTAEAHKQRVALVRKTLKKF